MKSAVVGGLMVLGSAFVLLAAVGIVRLPDVFTRMHAATKPATLGIGLIIVAVVLHFGEVGIATRALLVAAFFVLTVPVGAHMIGRAAYLSGTPLWEGTAVDEWQGRAERRPDAARPADPPAADAG